MRFTHEGVEYLLEFERQYHVPGGSIVGLERPYTTAKVFKVTGPGKNDREVVREYTVGLHHKDRFSYDEGRKVALAMALFDAPTKYGGEPVMTTRLSKDFKRALWDAYHKRKPNNPIQVR